MRENPGSVKEPRGRLEVHCGRAGVSKTSALEVMLALGEGSEEWAGPGSPGMDGQGKQRLGAVETEIILRRIEESEAS